MTDARPDLDVVIDDLGFGPAQWRFVVAVMYKNLSGGFFMQLLSPIGRSISEDLNFSNEQRGGLASLIFAGLLLGCSAASFADNIGRRVTWLAGAAIQTAGIMLIAISTDYSAVAFEHVLVGFGLGIMVPVQSTLAGELCPAKDRVFLSNFSSMFPYITGMLLALAVVQVQDPSMKYVDWRWTLLLIAVPGAFFWVIAYLFLAESPRYLAVQGRHDEALAAVNEIARLHGKEPVTGIKCSEIVEGVNFRVVMSRMWPTISCLCLCTVTLNYAYYGTIYALPPILAGLSSGTSPTGHLALGALVELFAYLLAYRVGAAFTRRAILQAYLSLSILFTGLFVVSIAKLPSAGSRLTTSDMVAAYGAAAGMYVFRTVCTFGWVFVYLYATEVFPTIARIVGCSFVFAVGRLGSIAAPMIVELSTNLFFGGVMALCAANLLAVSFALPVETKDRPLGAIARELESLLPRPVSKPDDKIP